MIAAVVPLKRLRDAKSRLSPGLSAQEREELALRLLQRVLAALRDSGCVDRIALVTAERNLALDQTVTVLDDRGDLNASLLAGIEWSLTKWAAAVLIVPTDLPLVRPDDIRALVTDTPPPPSISIVGTQDGGTGALLLTPPDVIPPAFGVHSFLRHVSMARERGVQVRQPEIEGMALDLDTLGDLQLAREWHDQS